MNHPNIQLFKSRAPSRPLTSYVDEGGGVETVCLCILKNILVLLRLDLQPVGCEI